MEQEGILDFQALRAKFQEEELPMKQPRSKPALREKPKVVPPPQSPTHYLPAGARPSLLTSISQTLEGGAGIAPRVVFKDDKSKNPLIKANSKAKEKSEEKMKDSKDKTAKRAEEKRNENSPEQKGKKENGKDKKFPFVMSQKESTAELVPATPPPKATTQKKKGFLGFKKSTKKESAAAPADPILDTPSLDASGTAPLIPVPTGLDKLLLEPQISAAPPPEAILPEKIPPPDPGVVVETIPSSPIPEPPAFSPPPPVFSDIPALQVPTPRSETPETETPPDTEVSALQVSRPASQSETPPVSPATIPDPPPADPAPIPALLEPEVSPEAAAEVEEEEPPPVVINPQSVPSPKAERPISALSALERAADMSPGKKASGGDLRILSALEKARKKSSSPLSHPSRSHSISPPPEDLRLSPSPTAAVPELPPIDYEGGARRALPPTPEAQVNGINHGAGSPELRGTAEEGIDAVPELLNVPPPPPRQPPPQPALDLSPESPDSPPADALSEFIPPTLILGDIPVPPEFSESDALDVPATLEFDDVASDAGGPELPESEWRNEEYTAPDVPDGHDLPVFYSNGITDEGAELHLQPTYGDEYQHASLPESPLPIAQDSPPVEEPKAEDPYSLQDSVDNTLNGVSPSPNKKKGKKNSGKKRKGTPKNPYAEAPQETVQEKSKTIRFGRSEKKATTEGLDDKEQKKKEKQQKKEQKERQEREKKEQKEKEKRENELKKKFKVTGQEEAMYQATVTVTPKARKNDLPIKTGDVISIIRTTNCPKGKWLARDSSSNYGYVAVDHVELDIKEMMELGKKTARKSSSKIIEADVASTGSRASNHFPQSTESFTDDSEEWTCDDDEPVSPAPETPEPFSAANHNRTLSMPDMGNKELPINHQHSHSDDPDGTHVQARHEALQKLATFFHSPVPVKAPASHVEAETTPAPPTEEAEHEREDPQTQETDFDPSTLILPPPDLYADLTLE
ncbi:unnamed protein product [Menidia menidia]|uniref:(Atlantic silverside) hypothetical protein n=1 Tax=Menidia menidia TaxID=238744 RepID=A0A8S4AKJ0_9TELE|nr:unnamed protein product [Menidia menidia]